MTITPSNISEFQMEVDIKATPEQVWLSLTKNIGDWWPAEFYAGGEEGKRTFILESSPGGIMKEVWDSGGGICWGSIVCVDPNVRLQVLGTSFPPWGGPSQWYGTWDLVPSGDGTTLKFSEQVVGRVSDAAVENKDKGWRFLWNTLKARVEGEAAPVWSD